MKQSTLRLLRRGYTGIGHAQKGTIRPTTLRTSVDGPAPGPRPSEAEGKQKAVKTGGLASAVP